MIAMNRTLAVLVLLLPLASCALFESPTTRALRRTPDYRAGYGDGCASAGTSANPRADTQIRDAEAYRANAAYRQGWNEGHGACRSTNQMQSNPLANGGLPPLPPR